MTQVKLCGLSRPQDIEMANTLKPDYIGFVFARGSRRYVTPGAAEALRRELAPGIQAVGVFVNEKPDLIEDLLRQRIIDIVQFHGNEAEEDILQLRRHFSAPVFKAFPVKTAADIVRAEHSIADLVLFDTGAGGTGQTFPWELTRASSRPFLLAGGLSPANVEEAIRCCRPFAVDVSSGIETGGVKDPSKAREFMRRVRLADRQSSV